MDYAGIGLSVVGCLFIVLGYFLRMIHADVRTNTEETGKNKGKIEQLRLSLENEVKIREIELKNQQESTQDAIKNLAENVSELTRDIKMIINNNLNGK